MLAEDAHQVRCSALLVLIVTSCPPQCASEAKIHAANVHGFDVQITASGSILAKLDKTDGMVGREITIYGGDPAAAK